MRELYITKGLHMDHMIAGAERQAWSGEMASQKKRFADPASTKSALYKITTNGTSIFLTKKTEMDENVENMRIYKSQDYDFVDRISWTKV